MSEIFPFENKNTGLSLEEKIILGVFSVLLIGLIVTMFFIPNPDFPQVKETTRICQASYGKPVCNDYNGWLEAKSNGCTQINVMDNPSSEICGTYTIEHIEQK